MPESYMPYTTCGVHIYFFNSTSLVKQSIHKMKVVNYYDLRIGVSNKQLEVN